MTFFRTGSSLLGAARRYLVILGLVFAFFVIRLALDPLLDERSPLILFTLPVVITAVRYGTGAAIAAMLLCTLLGVFAFIEPRHSLYLDNVSDMVNIGAFWATCVGVLFVTRKLADARAQAAISVVSLREREQELRRQYDLLQSVIDGALDPIFVKDRQGSFVLANKRLAEIFNTTPDAIIGRRDSDFLPADAAAVIEATDQKIMATGQAMVIEEVVPEAEGFRIHLSAKSPWQDRESQVVGLIGVARDITDRKRAEAAVTSSEAQLRAFFEASTAGLVQVDPSTWRFAQINAAFCRLTGYAADELQDMTVADLTHPEDWAVDKALLEPMLRGEEPAYSAETRYVRKDGMIVHVTVGASLIRDKEGRPHRAAAVIIDTTDRHSAEEQIRRLYGELEQRVVERTRELGEINEELNAFTYTVSHDLRAPLRAMEGFARILLDDYAEGFDDDGKRYALRIVTAAERMEALINDLLTYSRLTRSELIMRPVDLPELTQQCVKEVSTDVPVEWSIAHSLPPVLAEPAVLRQVLINLVTNAAKFQTQGQAPRISISIQESGKRVRVTVIDNGIGIAPEHHERIFRVFERLHGQESYAGTGVGLAIVRKGIERMGGACGVESEPGKGSHFWIELPCSTGGR